MTSKSQRVFLKNYLKNKRTGGSTSLEGRARPSGLERLPKSVYRQFLLSYNNIVARYIIITMLLILIGFSGYQGYKLYLQKTSLEKKLSKINNQLDGIYKENQKLVADIEYFKRPENLAKELKSRFNYVNPGEKLLIIVPKH